MTRRVNLGLVDGQLILTKENIKEIAKNANDEIISAVKAELDSCFEYEGYDDVIGLQVDYENNRFVRLAGAKGLKPGNDFDKYFPYNKMKRLQIDENGEILSAIDSFHPWMVYIPKFYYKVEPLKLDKINPTSEYDNGFHIRKANYFISDKQYSGFKLHPAFINEQGEEVDYFYYSAYEGGKYTSDTEADRYTNNSISGFDKSKYRYIVSQINTYQGSGNDFNTRNSETFCMNAGTGFHCETIKSLSALQFLMMIEYGTLNFRNYFIGNYNSQSETGTTQSLGNQSGNANGAELKPGDKSFSYRGIENPYGNYRRFIRGIIISNNNVYLCTDFNYKYTYSSTNKNYERLNFTISTLSSYINAFGYEIDGKHDWIFVPSETKGNSNLPVGDTYIHPSSNSTYFYLHGGYTQKKQNGIGLFNSNLSNQSNTYSSNECCRLIYLPQH